MSVECLARITTIDMSRKRGSSRPSVPTNTEFWFPFNDINVMMINKIKVFPCVLYAEGGFAFWPCSTNH